MISKTMQTTHTYKPISKTKQTTVRIQCATKEAAANGRLPEFETSMGVTKRVASDIFIVLIQTCLRCLIPIWEPLKVIHPLALIIDMILLSSQIILLYQQMKPIRG